MNIRRSTPADLERMLEIYASARQFMAGTGNPSQWPATYPAPDILSQDIASGSSYVVEADNKIVATFAFIVGDDPSYSKIDGSWLNDEPYGTIHRLASDGTERGVADLCLEFCAAIINNIRIDTHCDNKPMLGWIKRSGFSYCGVIHVADGTPRLAFQSPAFNHRCRKTNRG